MLVACTFVCSPILYAQTGTYIVPQPPQEYQRIPAALSSAIRSKVPTPSMQDYATPPVPRPNDTSQQMADPSAASNSPKADEPDAEEAKKKQAELKKKAASAYKTLFFENDFSYLCDPAYQGHLIGEALKKRCLPHCGSLDIGGQFRVRAQFENNIRGLGLTGVDDEFLLYRTRIYGDFRPVQNFRFYAELIDAESNYENFPLRPIEVNRVDMLNLFVDARLFSNHRGDLIARVGRQELLFGEQRLVSPLDWANTRRTFEGARVDWKTDDYSIASFWTNPMRVVDDRFDSPDRDQEFMGVYSTFKPKDRPAFDAYFLRYLNGRGTNDFQFNTIGVRVKGDRCGTLYDFESAYQFGRNTDGSDHAAGMATLGFGKKFDNYLWQPAAWLYYDWASGDNDLGAGNGFDHLFPLAHKYFGFMDLYGRRNIEDLNFRVTMQPTKKLSLLFWYHYMFLATQSDTPYSVVMTPFNPGNAPGSVNLGQEIDLTATWKFTPRQNLLLGYSHFFAGSYYSTTPGVPFDGDANFYYTQYLINF